MSKEYGYIRRAGLFAVFMLLTAALSCVRENWSGGDDPGDPDERVMVSATVMPGGNTRASCYIEDGKVEKGTYYILYNRKNGNGSTYYRSDAYVEFGYDGTTEAPGTGYAYFYPNGGTTRKDFKWRDVHEEGQKPKKFYLSNLSPDAYDYYNASNSSYWYHFKPKSPNPYVTSPLDTENGTNDLLIGSTTASAGQKIEFKLNHVLSLLKINIEVYSSTDDQSHYINLENAKVSISNLATEVADISFEYPSTYVYTSSYKLSNSNYNGHYTNVRNDDDPILLVNPAGVANDETVEKPILWDKEMHGTQIDNKRVYSTQRFVMPPQPIPPTSSTARPRLVVEVPNRDVTGDENAEGTTIYSGYIPTIMFDVDDDGNIIADSSPENIALRSGYQLTITASINSPNLELVFTPVRIERWVNEGEYTFRLKQAGIYDDLDFDNLIKTYNDLAKADNPNWELLERFGYTDNGHLIVQLWSNISLDFDKISGMMAVDGLDGVPEFSFALNGYTVTLTKQEPDADKPRELGELYGREGQAKLYRIVTDKNFEYGENDESFAGINSTGKLKSLIEILTADTAPDVSEIMKYGAISNMDNTLVFDIADSFEVDLEDIFQKLPETISGYTLSFTLKSGKEVTVNVPDRNTGGTAGQIKCESGAIVDKVIIDLSNKGFRSAEELYLLIDCYNNLYTAYPDLLKMFGAKNSADKWTFYVRNAMTVDGNKVFVSMEPDPANGRPDYTVSNSNNIITYEHDKIPFSSSSNTDKILSGTGSFTGSTTRLTGSVKTAYNNNTDRNKGYADLWAYARWDNANSRWIFPMNHTGSQQYATYTNLFGAFIVDEANGKYEYEFIIGGYKNSFQVQSMPNSGPDDTSKSTHTFFQDGDASDYPNSAEDLKRVANGTYWEYYEEWKKQNP